MPPGFHSRPPASVLNALRAPALSVFAAMGLVLHAQEPAATAPSEKTATPESTAPSPANPPSMPAPQTQPATPTTAPTTAPTDSLELLPSLDSVFAPTTENPLAPIQTQPERTRIPALPPLQIDRWAGSLTPVEQPRIHVRRFSFKGNRALKDSTLRRAVAPWEGRDCTSEDLEAARQAVTEAYIKAGYLNSGALLEPQDLHKGGVLLTIIEGRLTEVRVSGNRWFRDWWLRHEVRRAAGSPLNAENLSEGLQTLRQTPGIAQVNAELLPGGSPGTGIVDIKVRDTAPFRASVNFKNDRPPSIGSEAVELQLADLNLLGMNDPLVISYIPLHRGRSGYEPSGLDLVHVSYTLPATPWGGTLELRAGRSDTGVIEEAFRPLNIESHTTELGATLRQPIRQTPTWELAASVGLDRRRNETTLLNVPFSLSRGAIDGDTEVTALRTTLEWVVRSQKQVFALRSTVSFGLNAGEATIQPRQSEPGGQIIPDARFVTWLTQAQYLRRIGASDNLLVLRLNTQLSNDALLSLEQFALGGIHSVRGYRENTLLRDNGVFGSAELRIPLWQKGRDEDKRTLLTIAPFLDVGSCWRTVDKSEADQGPDQESLLSAGIALHYEPHPRVFIDLAWAYGFNRSLITTKDRNLQDYGIHFNLGLTGW